MLKKSQLFALAAIFLCAIFVQESGATNITFNLDSPGPHANPFTSIESSLVMFSEVGDGAYGAIGINPFQSTTNVLDSSMGSGGPDAILMEFLVPVKFLSFNIGHAGGLTNHDGWLRVFEESSLVSDSRVSLDSNNLFDQVIAYSGSPIDSALYAIVATGSTDLGLAAESIDNVTFDPIPEPTTMLLLGAGLIGLAGLGRKKFFKKD